MKIYKKNKLSNQVNKSAEKILTNLKDSMWEAGKFIYSCLEEIVKIEETGETGYLYTFLKKLDGTPVTSKSDLKRYFCNTYKISMTLLNNALQLYRKLEDHEDIYKECVSEEVAIAVVEHSYNKDEKLSPAKLIELEIDSVKVKDLLDDKILREELNRRVNIPIETINIPTATNEVSDTKITNEIVEKMGELQQAYDCGKINKVAYATSINRINKKLFKILEDFKYENTLPFTGNDRTDTKLGTTIENRELLLSDEQGKDSLQIDNCEVSVKTNKRKRS
jgi:cation transport regulator ChaB